jgi:predicted DsbA family dithiol-disulfide isomerase
MHPEVKAMKLVVYGDFNCPFSAVASDRVARLEADGRGSVDWRAVEHDPSLSRASVRVDAARRAEFEREIEMIRDQAMAGEFLGLRPPAVLVNTSELVAAYASLGPAARPAARQQLFHSYWSDGTDIGAPDVVSSIGTPSDGAQLAAEWHAQWAALDRPIVPAMILPDGRVSRGLGVLARLADFLGSPDVSLD